ncbi:hypothetical protein L1987_82444 [Smallanthus sonchifolius]|uniref:Uncharacterized protein n=1 Tax=Smallanthus sonchifolius TaxID=185202 RepID=A0ACB8YBF3_9ASTR|nr:hypothetical protein L1987_82444 [Smallanthus sonchifolius]
MKTMAATATSLPSFTHHAIKHPSLPLLLSRATTHYLRRPPRATVNTSISATPNGVFLLSEAKPPENSDQIVSAVADNGDGISVVIQLLLAVAFFGLSVLTIGVIYIAVTDFLQKREKEKFEKEEAEKAKKGGKKKRVRPRVGPKGFGQKIDDDDDL